jgi:hypothetical protein
MYLTNGIREILVDVAPGYVLEFRKIEVAL